MHTTNHTTVPYDKEPHFTQPRKYHRRKRNYKTDTDTVHKKNCEEKSCTINVDTEVEVNSIDQEVTPSDDEYAQSMTNSSSTCDIEFRNICSLPLFETI